MGKTPALLVRLVESTGLVGSGKVIVLDSGFCVLRGLVELRKRGVFASAIIKKKRVCRTHQTLWLLSSHLCVSHHLVLAQGCGGRQSETACRK
jgi:hypothetical protein